MGYLHINKEVFMSEPISEPIPTYYAGQTIAVPLTFFNYGVADIDLVAATFQHDEDHTA